MPRIYLDYASTTPISPEVFRAMRPYFSSHFGNPGSLHLFGQETMGAVDAARETLAESLGVDFREVIFTGSATEANNLALRGALAAFRRAYPARRPKIIISAIEHESVAATARFLAESGLSSAAFQSGANPSLVEAKESAELVVIPVNGVGRVDPARVAKAVDQDTAIVSIMFANNEIGAIQPVREIAAVIRAIKEMRNEKLEMQARSPRKKSSLITLLSSSIFPLIHTDAVQALQFLSCRPAELGVDLLTLSAHKIYGPKGIGALCGNGLGGGHAPDPIVTGGGQEFGWRSGTENVAAIVGFAEAVRRAEVVREREAKRLRSLSLRLLAGIRRIAPKATVNGPGPNSKSALPNILNIRFPGHLAEELTTRFDLLGLAVSSGSACASRRAAPSATLLALGGDKARARESVRFSIGQPTSARHIDMALAVIKAQSW